MFNKVDGNQFMQFKKIMFLPRVSSNSIAQYNYNGILTTKCIIANQNCFGIYLFLFFLGGEGEKRVVQYCLSIYIGLSYLIRK